jgi:hypothetical protein
LRARARSTATAGPSTSLGMTIKDNGRSVRAWRESHACGETALMGHPV